MFIILQIYLLLFITFNFFDFYIQSNTLYFRKQDQASWSNRGYGLPLSRPWDVLYPSDYHHAVSIV